MLKNRLFKKFVGAVLSLFLFISLGFSDIYVIHSCSGGGKDTLVQKACLIVPKIVNVPRISTRPLREKEVQDVDLTSVSDEVFDKMMDNGEIIYKEEIKGAEKLFKYGANAKKIREEIDKGNDVFLIGKFGTIGESFPDVKVHHVLITISKKTQRKRLGKRGSDSDADVDKRCSNAESDLKYGGKYAHKIISNDPDFDVDNGNLFEWKALKELVYYIFEMRAKNDKGL